MKVRDIVSKELIVVEPGARIDEIARTLVENRISGVPVVDKSGRLVGIVSEGDLLRKETLPRLPNAVNILGAVIYYNGVERYNEDFKKLLAGTAREIMTRRVITVTEDAEVTEVGELMLKHNIKRVPVVREGRLIGIVSRADIMKALF